MEFLGHFKKGKYAKYTLIEQFFLKLDEKNDDFSYFLILTVEALIYIHAKTKEHIWTIDTKNIKRPVSMPEGINIELY